MVPRNQGIMWGHFRAKRGVKMLNFNIIFLNYSFIFEATFLTQ